MLSATHVFKNIGMEVAFRLHLKLVETVRQSNAKRQSNEGTRATELGETIQYIFNNYSTRARWISNDR